MTTEETKPGWSATAKGIVGAGLLAIAGFFGTAAMNVLSAPKDSVAYDLIQSLTGLLKNREAPPPPAQPAPVAVAPAAPETPKARAPQAAERQAAFIPQPATPVVPAPEAAPPPTPASPQPQARGADPSGPAEVPASSKPAPGGIADRMRQTSELANKIAAANAALAGSRVLSLDDRAEASICGATYRLEVTSVGANKGAVALRSAGAGPVTLSVGQPRELGAGCRVELLLAMEDLENRRAQLRETRTR